MIIVQGHIAGSTYWLESNLIKSQISSHFLLIHIPFFLNHGQGHGRSQSSKPQKCVPLPTDSHPFCFMLIDPPIIVEINPRGLRGKKLWQTKRQSFMELLSAAKNLVGQQSTWTLHSSNYQQSKSGGFDSCDRPSNFTQIRFKSSILSVHMILKLYGWPQ